MSCEALDKAAADYRDADEKYIRALNAWHAAKLLDKELDDARSRLWSARERLETAAKEWRHDPDPKSVHCVFKNETWHDDSRPPELMSIHAYEDSANREALRLHAEEGPGAYSVFTVEKWILR